MRNFEDDQKIQQVKEIFHQLEETLPSQSGDCGSHRARGDVAKMPCAPQTLNRVKSEASLYSGDEPSVDQSLLPSRRSFRSLLLLDQFSSPSFAIWTGFVGASIGVLLYFLLSFNTIFRDQHILSTIKPSLSPHSQSLEHIDPGSKLSEAQVVPYADYLIQTGQILKARALLEKAHKAYGNNTNIVLYLARSYDVETLKYIASANAQPDVERAKYWYAVYRALQEKVQP